MASRSDLINAFVPSSSMDDPSRFSGRAEEVKQLADAVRADGTVPLIYGQRGLGKSSIAVQLSRIAQGDPELLRELDAGNRIVPEEEQAIAFYVTCEDSTKDLDGLLRMMINAVEKLQFEELAKDHGSFKMVDKTTKTGVSLKLFNHEQVRSYQSEVRERDLSALTPSERLVYLAETLTSTYGQRVIFIIDELDRLDGVKGLASFLKANSSPILKFALVGIATTEGELLADHGSLGRQLVPVMIGTMKPRELNSIVRQTELFLKDAGWTFDFEEEAAVELSHIAAGFPWFVHVIGQRLLIEADDQARHVIRKEDVSEAVKLLATRQMAQTFFDAYQKAVRDSLPRETVLRLFASWPQDHIPTSEMYPVAKALGVGGAATYVGHLTKDQCGSVLARAPQQNRALYYFPDQMFKTYVSLRPAIYEGVDEDIERVRSERRAQGV